MPYAANLYTRRLSSHHSPLALTTGIIPVMHIPKYPALKSMQNSSDDYVCHYDDSEEIGSVSKDMSSRTDAWFDELSHRVHPLIREIPDPLIRESRDPLIQSEKHRPLAREGRTRIAILDTGIELAEADYWAYGDRILHTKSWLSNAEDEKDIDRGDRDLDSHGTHAAALLLKVAPKADICVARVFKDRRESNGVVTAETIHGRIASAIRYTVNSWQVNIISISFSFKESVKIIDKAIRFADENNVIMLAAASNQGGNSIIAWPARREQVICIYATDSLGNRCDFTPTETPGSDNFAILGQAVSSCWPPHLKQGNDVRKSGTSTATPIAAGIAAIVLDFVKLALRQWYQEISERDARTFRKLQSSAGMSTVFRRMAKRPRAGYHYIVPWDFLDINRYKLATVCDIIIGDLKDM